MLDVISLCPDWCRLGPKALHGLVNTGPAASHGDGTWRGADAASEIAGSLTLVFPARLAASQPNSSGLTDTRQRPERPSYERQAFDPKLTPPAMSHSASTCIISKRDLHKTSKVKYQRAAVPSTTSIRTFATMTIHQLAGLYVTTGS